MYVSFAQMTTERHILGLAERKDLQGSGVQTEAAWKHTSADTHVQQTKHKRFMKRTSGQAESGSKKKKKKMEEEGWEELQREKMY